MSEDLSSVECPMRGCEGELQIVWHIAYSPYKADLDRDDGLAPAVDSHTQSWDVGCTEGHVLLLPGYPGCDCDDPEGPNCPHHADDYDWSDDFRRFRRHDMERLRHLLAVSA